jgi:HlyD family secretion protein
VPISAVVIKEDTTSVKKDIVAELEKEEKEKKGTYKSNQKFECVFVKVGDKAKLRVVKTGIQDDTNIEIVSGLKKGEEIITGPYTVVSKELNSNDKVKTEEKSLKKK